MRPPETPLDNPLRERLYLAFALLLLLALHFFTFQPTEPFFNNDETRHLLTGVYFRDFFQELPARDAVNWTVRYYLQYPALGLLVWPPFFYAAEGALMSVFGVSMLVGQAAAGLSALLACVYVYRFVRLTHDAPQALGAVLLFGVAPMAFKYSRLVMLEMPTLALALAATFHFRRYLETTRRRDIFAAAIFSALAALTRFDAGYLLPLFVLMLVIKKRWGLLRRGEVWLAAALALALVAPALLITAKYVGWLHFRQVSETNFYNAPGTFSAARWWYYLQALPRNFLGWPLFITALCGFLLSWRKESRARAWPHLACVCVVYVVFSLISEMDERHAFYWLPAWAFFAAHALWRLAQTLKQPKFYAPLLLLVIFFTLRAGLPAARLYVRGYAEAARYVLENSADSPFCFFSGRLNGNLIYQIRHQDPARRLWTLRADKLLYNDFAASAVDARDLIGETQMLDTIYRYDPTMLVVEEPAGAPPFPMLGPARQTTEQRIRELLAAHPERFRLEREINVESNAQGFRGMKLKIYRNLQRNPQPSRNLQFENLNLRGTLQTEVSR